MSTSVRRAFLPLLSTAGACLPARGLHDSFRHALLLCQSHAFLAPGQLVRRALTPPGRDQEVLRRWLAGQFITFYANNSHVKIWFPIGAARLPRPISNASGSDRRRPE
jgi:hypothetical protein